MIEPKEDEYSSLPPMEKPIVETTPTLIGYSRVPYPSDEIMVYRNWKKSARSTTAYGTSLWNISVMHPKNRVLLSDDNIQEILQFGKEFASEDD